MAGCSLLLLCAAASLLLVLEHYHGIRLPGCGPAGGCAEALKSVWARVPGLNWPMSHLGLAYFTALFLAHALTRGTHPAALHWVIRLGALASLGFGLVMLVKDLFCPYCAVVHLGNVAFAVLVEWSNRMHGTLAPRVPGSSSGPAAASRSLIPFTLTFLALTAVLALIERQQAGAAAGKAETALAQSTAKIVDLSRQSVRKDPPDPKRPAETVQQLEDEHREPDDTGETDPASGDEDSLPHDVPESTGPPFTGRYRIGPEPAPIRIVAISSYQCPDCRRIDEEIQALLAGRSDISFSFKHFPFCSDCNRFARERNVNLHPNGCWAARAAEAAGMIEGNDGFWKMHRWLFGRGGSFTADELKRGLAELGFDTGRFIPLMQGGDTEALVKADIEEAMMLGLSATPMIFINGVELKGWNAPQAVTRAVGALTATNPPPLTAEADRPPTALDKYLDDWREQPVRSIPADSFSRSLGQEDAPLEVVVWGDYLEPRTAELDRRIRAVVGKTDPTRLRYTFRHFPVDKSCNPGVPSTKHPGACRAALAAEAAGLVAGEEAFWRMHEWLLDHQDSFSDEQLKTAAPGLGFDSGDLFESMDHPDAAAAVGEDIEAARRLGLRSIPFFFVDGKWVPRWKLEGHRIPELIIEEALGEADARMPPSRDQ